MAFSLSSLVKGKRKTAQDGSDRGLEDDPFVSGPEKTPAGAAAKPAGKKKKKRKKKAPGPLARILAKLPGGKGRTTVGDGPDPFDNPEIMALIAAEVAALPPPPEDDEVVEAEAPPLHGAPPAPAARAAGDGDEDLGPYLEEAAPAEAAGQADSGAEDGLAVDDETAFGALAALEEDDEAEAAYFRRRRRNSIIASSLAASVLVCLGLGIWWLTGMTGSEDEQVAASGGLQVYTEQDGLAPPQLAQSGDRIRMALPAPPGSAAPAGAADEKSRSRRPWLAEGGPVSGETGGALPAPAAASAEDHSAAPPAAAESAPPTAAESGPEAVPESATEMAGAAPSEPAPADHGPAAADSAAPAPAPESPATAPPPASAPAPEDAAEAPPQLAGLPPLVEPQRPPAPAETPRTPSFDQLPLTAQPDHGLGEAPLPGLVRQSPLGPLPIKASDGATAWQAYARPFSTQALARVAIIVTGLGLNPAATEAAITRLPPGVTLSFSPYARGLDAQVRKARAYGHEVLLDLPMEPEGFPAEDPGPLAMLTALPQSENLTRLETILGKAAGYTGLTGRFAGKYGASRVHMRTVLESLAQRGLLYVHTAAPEAVTENADLGVPVAQSLLAIDERPFREAIDARLQYLAEAAKLHGVAVGVAGPYPVTFERLDRFLADMQRAGIALAPASAAVRPPTTASTQGAEGRGHG